ncbi:MAG: hypothetical protein IJZ39_08805 [Oscillospiraceae bacterium]|nr:hypothetical protein [Oscillospiraceae bacterium]
MFETGQWVVYGVHGVCRVAGREKQLVNRKRTEYLVLEPMAQNESRYFVPTANATAMAKLREVLSAEELKALLVSAEIRQDCWIADENQRKQHYRDLTSNGDRVSILKMTHCLYRYKEAQLAAGRKFHLCDDNFLRDAEKLLASEISLVLEMTQEEAREYLRETLKA